MMLHDARAQSETLFPIPTSSSYARLEITGDDALLFTENKITRLEGPKVRLDMAIENATGFRAAVPFQIIHLNAVARMGYEVIGPVHPDADEFLLRRVN